MQSANERTEAPLCPKRDRFQRSDDTKRASDQYVGSTIDEGASFFLLDVFSFPCFRPYLHLMVSPRAFRHSLDQYEEYFADLLRPPLPNIPGFVVNYLPSVLLFLRTIM